VGGAREFAVLLAIVPCRGVFIISMDDWVLLQNKCHSHFSISYIFITLIKYIKKY
jgi:hypothetical protein